MTAKPASNITNEPKDNVDKVVMNFMSIAGYKLQEILISPEYKECLKVLLEENLPVFNAAELLIVEVLMQMVESRLKDFEKVTGNKTPEGCDLRDMVKKYLENPKINFSTRWRLYEKQELN